MISAQKIISVYIRQPFFIIHNLSDQHNMNLDLDLELRNERGMIARNFHFSLNLLTTLVNYRVSVL